MVAISCDQSICDRHGVRIADHTLRPMDLKALRVDEFGNVIVDTGEITERDSHNLSQAVSIDAR